MTTCDRTEAKELVIRKVAPLMPARTFVNNLIFLFVCLGVWGTVDFAISGNVQTTIDTFLVTVPIVLAAIFTGLWLRRIDDKRRQDYLRGDTSFLKKEILKPAILHSGKGLRFWLFRIRRVESPEPLETSIMIPYEHRIDDRVSGYLFLYPQRSQFPRSKSYGFVTNADLLILA